MLRVDSNTIERRLSKLAMRLNVENIDTIEHQLKLYKSGNGFYKSN